MAAFPDEEAAAPDTVRAGRELLTEGWEVPRCCDSDARLEEPVERGWLPEVDAAREVAVALETRPAARGVPVLWEIVAPREVVARLEVSVLPEAVAPRAVLVVESRREAEAMARRFWRSVRYWLPERV